MGQWQNLPNIQIWFNERTFQMLEELCGVLEKTRGELVRELVVARYEQAKDPAAREKVRPGVR